jgi:hypothetical protein
VKWRLLISEAITDGSGTAHRTHIPFSGKGVFDKESRKKPLALAADAANVPMEIEWRLGAVEGFWWFGGKRLGAAREGLSGGAETGKRSREGWPEQGGRVRPEVRADGITGMHWARRGSALAHGLMKSLCNCTERATALR